MSNPYNEIFETVIALSRKQGYATFDYLPDDRQGYPFVYIGTQQNVDIETKDRTLGKTHIQIDVYAEHNRRSEVMTIMEDLQMTVSNHQRTENFIYAITHGESHMIGDTTSDIPLWHGILELDIKYY